MDCGYLWIWNGIQQHVSLTKFHCYWILHLLPVPFSVVSSRNGIGIYHMEGEGQTLSAVLLAVGFQPATMSTFARFAAKHKNYKLDWSFQIYLPQLGRKFSFCFCCYEKVDSAVFMDSCCRKRDGRFIRWRQQFFVSPILPAYYSHFKLSQSIFLHRIILIFF